MKIPFVKLHGAHNDFLLTWRDQVPPALPDKAAAAIAICERHTGVGADGWIVVAQVSLPGAGLPAGGADGKAPADQEIRRAAASIELWNSDGSRSEISGNGTRCAAALLVDAGYASTEIGIATGAGVKSLRLLERDGRKFSFEMNMGAALIEELHAGLVPGRPSVILNVGNPQCAVFVPDFDWDWRALGATIESHPQFPNRSNVSFVRVLDDHTLEARFYERGAGETMSSGTGSMGAAAAAIALGLATSPARVLTPAGPLDVRLEGQDYFLAGPAEIVASGEYYFGR